MNMTILHISYATTWGGGEQQMIDLIESLNLLGIKNPLVCLRKSMLYNYASKHKLDTIVIENRGDLKKVKAYLKTNCDLIHIHTGSFIFDFIKLKLFNRIKQPCIYTINGIMRKKSFFSKLKYNFYGINAIHFVSKAAKNNFAKNIAFKSSLKKLHVIYDGINSSEKSNDFKSHKLYKHVYENDFIVVNIANHTRAKNLMSLIDVANEIVNVRNEKTVKFFQIGRESDLTESYQKKIKELNLDNNVFFVGFLENAETYLSSFSALLITSNREGLPLTIMEAFKYKVPVITTNAGGIPECVFSEINGFISEIDDFQSLSNQLLYLKGNYEALSKEIIKNAYSNYLDKYTSNKMGANTLDLYKIILKKVK